MSQQTKTEVFSRSVVNEKPTAGSGLRLLVLGLVLIALTVIFFLFRDQLGEGFVLALLGLLAMLGVFYLIGSTIGLIKFNRGVKDGQLSHSFLDTMPEGTVVSDTKGHIVYANQAYAQMTGAANSDELRSLDAILTSESGGSDAIYRLSNAVRDGFSAQEEIRLTGPLVHSHNLHSTSLTPTWYRIKARPVAASELHKGPLVAWQIADISQERAEQERFFQDLQEAIDHLDHAPAGFFSADASGRIIYLNATLAEWLGVDLAGFVPGSLTLNDIVAGNGMALINSVKAEPGSSRNSVIDLDLAKRNGQSLAVRFYHRVQMQRDGLRGTSRTIVLNRAEGDDSSAALRSAEVRFTRFFNSAPMAIAAVDSKGHTLRTNARFLDIFSGVVESDVAERRLSIESVVHERDREAFSRALTAAFAGQASITPIDTVLPGNEERHVRFYISPVTDIGGEDADEAAIVSAVETTEQKALEGQMAQSQKMQAVGQLAGGIAHDFNNVLTAIIMSSDLLLSNHRASDPSFPDIMNIKQNANRAASLVRQLLAFSRRQTLRPEVLDLTDVLADLRMLLARLVGKDIDLKIEHGRDLWPVRADLGQFEQVAVNLAVNARDAMPDGGLITLRTRNMPQAEVAALQYHELPEADYVMFEVQDSGSGIAPDVLEKIFEPFFTTKEVGKGTGLGLSMVYGIIKQTGGFIYCDSELGTGTVFKIFLPRHVVEHKAVSEQAPAIKEKKQEKNADLSGSATVLLVEDEDAVRMGGVRALQSRGYTVHEAASGVEALEVLEELGGKVDIVVSDVVMPEMDGPTLLRELRIHYPDIKFIFVSGYAEDAFARNLPEDAKFGFLPKPFSLKQLATAVKEMLEKED
ncbi:two-component system cell cycle sensor histidine kinase/response regulator CckA [Paenochrobactrum gallinarii]|uniref:histidine kinase n=1 Tax=Paenochrobactrum gallinarii TaxID=643673 RepID=A0A841LTL9_9HYPH|nr:response regulator [Paenochrobactrum gallinarii]MBB6261605.1 two-component system cell cycle sensor histidine kinase/response regulator CckA [Paenochrobactrum gallinarii]